jgi:DNA-binding NtrC family response regulator
LAEGLYRRWNSFSIAFPRLKQRREDVPLLARHFVTTIGEINHLPPITIEAEAMTLLRNYDWPGNVQELRNSIEHAVILASGGTIAGADLPDRIRESESVTTGLKAGSGNSRGRFRDGKRKVVEAFEQAYLSELLDRHQGNVTSASQQAGMLRSALQRLLRKYGFKSADFRRRRTSPTLGPTDSPGD